MSGDNAKQEMRLQGVGVSPGVARGTLYVVEDDRDDVVKHRIEASQIPTEIGRFETALIQTRSQILEMQERIAQSIGAKDAGIFDAHLPAVVGLHDASEKLANGREVLLDGYNGLLILDPTPETLWHYGELEHKRALVTEQLTGLRETKSTTRDGRHIVLSANIELPDEVDSVITNGAEGVGLYRTEFLYLNRTTLPSEEEQYETYRTVAEHVAPNPLIIRTF